MTATMIETAPETEPVDTAPDAADQPFAVEDEGLAHDVGTLEYHFPEDLVLDAYNHRKKINTEPDAKLKASVRELGVQDPVGARPQPDGTIGIYKGQRRWKAQLIANVAAKKAGRPLRKVPVLVRRDLAGVDDDTLVLSMIENTHREQSSQRDVTDALTQLALMDIPDTKRAKHARRLGYKPAEVAAANRAAQLPDEKLEQLSTAGWDFVELGDYAEVQSLSRAWNNLSDARRADTREGNKKRGNWEQAMAKLRAELVEQQKREEITAELEAAEVPIVRFQYTWTDAVRPLSHLLNALGKKMTPKAHAEVCPDHAAYIDRDKPRAVYVCRNWSGNGHALTPAEAAKVTTESPEDKEATKAERKRVVQGNKDWRAAREVRTSFLIRLINPGKDDPKELSDAAWSWVMKCMSGSTHWYPRYLGKDRTAEISKLLKMDDPNENRGYGKMADDPFGKVIARRGRPGRGHILFAQLAAAFERENMHDLAWRHPDAETAEWLEFLASEGHTLDASEKDLIETVKARRVASEKPDDRTEADDEEELDQALADAEEESGKPSAEADGVERPEDDDEEQREDGGTAESDEVPQASDSDQVQDAPTAEAAVSVEEEPADQRAEEFAHAA